MPQRSALKHDRMERKGLMTGDRKGPHDFLEKGADNGGSGHGGGMASTSVFVGSEGPTGQRLVFTRAEGHT